MKLPSNPRQLNRRIVIEAEQTTADESGGHTRPEWVEFTAAWAQFSARTGSESFEAMRERGVATYDVAIRWQGGIEPKMRLRDGVRVFNIIAPPMDPDGRRRWLVIAVEEEG